MNFHLTHQLPEKCLVAVSGGIDSMSILHFLLNKPGRVQGVLHVNHNTGWFSDAAEKVVKSYCDKKNLLYSVHHVKNEPPKSESKEAFWRNERYKFFHGFHKHSIILGHTLDDCVEEYIMCTMVRGYPGVIPYRNGNCIRPFRLTSKENLLEYAIKNGLPTIEDPSNNDTKYKRNHIRHKIVPVLRELNPGLNKIVKKQINQLDRLADLMSEHSNMTESNLWTAKG